MAAQSCYSHNELHGKNTSDLHNMLFDKGINWNDYPDRSKRGGYFKKFLIERKYTELEFARLPEDHEARKNSDFTVFRHITKQFDIPILTKISNRVDVIFNGDEPISMD